MNIKIDIDAFRVKPDKAIDITQISTKIKPFYDSKSDYLDELESYKKEICDLQNMMYAHNEFSLLLIFQGMDTAGKDGAIKHVMSGINPAGVQVFSFKKPSSNELDHDFLWRTNKSMPERGRIGIFNRSYYEEVLVVKVHPEILVYQKLPSEFIRNNAQVFKNRYEDINNMEKYMHRNGTRIIKFFLHISKEEQRQRFLERIDRPEKNWKLSEADIKERKYWDDYQMAFQDCINETSPDHSPWFIVPGDSKKNARLIISQIILSALRDMSIHYPKVNEEHIKVLKDIRKQLVAEASSK